MTKSRNINLPKKTWATDERTLLASVYPCSQSSAVAKLFNSSIGHVYNQAHHLNIKKSAWFNASFMASKLKRGMEIGKEYRFKKGQIPPNKGKKCESHPNMVPTQFKPGTKPPNYKAVGSTRIDSKDGYILIKMAEGIFQWKLLHRVIWERLNGKIPDGYLVTFIDGDKSNIEITNFTLMTKQENLLRNSCHNYGTEIAELYQLKRQITRQINKTERARHERHSST